MRDTRFFHKIKLLEVTHKKFSKKNLVCYGPIFEYKDCMSSIVQVPTIIDDRAGELHISFATPAPGLLSNKNCIFYFKSYKLKMYNFLNFCL